MENLRLKYLSFLFLLINSCAQSSHKNVNNISEPMGFENQEMMYQGMPQVIKSIDTSSVWNKGDKNHLLITGKVYDRNTKNPVKGVIIYYYHTDENGIYSYRDDCVRGIKPNKLGQTHGCIRGWVMTNEDGQYFIYTKRPGSYPNRNEPAHIHLNIYDPAIDNSYYIDDVVFDDDSLLTTSKRLSLENRGGSGVVRLVARGQTLIGERNIYLEMNIPNYPIEDAISVDSGPSIGEDLFSFSPLHIYGNDKGKSVCPICKYGWYSGLLIFVNEDVDSTKLKQWLNYFEQLSILKASYFKVYLVVASADEDKSLLWRKRLEDWGQSLNLNHLALTMVPSFNDTLTHVNRLKINPDVQSTFIFFRRSKVVAKYIDPDFTHLTRQKIEDDLDSMYNQFFFQPKPTKYILHSN